MKEPDPSTSGKVVGLAAIEFLAVDLADEVDGQTVALLALPGPGGRFIFLEALAEVFQGFGHGLVGHLGLGAGELDRLEIDLGHIREDFELHIELEVLAVLEGLHLDLRSKGGLQLIVVDRLLRALVHRLLEHLAHHRTTVLLFQQGDRHLARAETRDLDGLFQLTQTLVDALLDFGGGDHDLIGASQSLGG